MLADFHFIYPLWLLALVPILALYLLLQRQQNATSQWRRLISPNLLPYLIDKAREGEQVRPYRLLIVVLLLATLALAGPTWQRESSPFSEDEAPLVIALDLSASMEVKDIQPSRLERSKQKIRDLLALRRTGRTALVAYSGSAHLVMPLTADTRILETYLADLTPEVMPRPGKVPAQALTVADNALSKAEVPGSILFVTDGIGIDQTAAFVEHQRHSQNEVLLLGVGTVAGGEIPHVNAESSSTYSRLDRAGLDAMARQAKAYVTEVTPDGTDIKQLNQHIQRHLAQVQDSDSDRWRNEGYWLLYPTAVLMLLWFRRGWSVQWLAIFLVLSLGCQPAAIAAPLPGRFPSLDLTSLSPSFINLWLTPDQQGRWLLDHGEYAEAAKRFDSPLWKGIAYYVNEEFEQAAEQFDQVKPKTPEVYFDLGNALAQQENYKDALKNYDRALGMRPDYDDAQTNRDLVQARLNREEELAKQRPEEEEGDLKADQIVEDDTPPPDNDDDNDHPRPNQDGLGGAALEDLWLQNVQTTPADFLKQKFQYQLEAEMLLEGTS
jgi:Ca-activated chloride channel family protein